MSEHPPQVFCLVLLKSSNCCNDFTNVASLCAICAIPIYTENESQEDAGNKLDDTNMFTLKCSTIRLQKVSLSEEIRF